MKETMKKLDALFESASDLFNPLAVRETRQGLRGNAFAYCVVVASALFSLALVCGSLSQTFDNSANSMKTGLNVFRFVFMALWAICCLIIPFSACSKAREEMRGGEFELFSVTGIPASKIALGKLQASLAQALLLCALAAPFLLACLLLRGVSAPDILLCLAGMLVYSACLTQIGILIGCLRSSKTMHSLCSIVFGFALFLLMILALTSLSERSTPFLFGTGGELWMRLSSLFVVPPMFGVLALLSTRAALELPGRNRTAPLKMAVSAMAVALPWIPIAIFQNKGMTTVACMLILAFPLCMACLMAPMARAFATDAEPVADKSSNILRRFVFGKGLGSTLIWLSLTALGMSCWEVFYSEGKGWLTVVAGVFLFWALVGNLAGLLFKKIHPLTLSLGGLIVPSVAAALAQFTPWKEFSSLLFPLGVPGYLMDKGIVAAGFRMSLVWWGLVLAAGIAIHLLRERRLR